MEKISATVERWTDDAMAVDSEGSTCRCVRDMILLLETLENCLCNAEHLTLDDLLSSQKQATRQCLPLLRCAPCVARSENMALMSMVLERLAQLCANNAKSYTESVKIPAINTRNQENKHQPRIFFGDYEVDNHVEWRKIVEVLLGSQVDALRLILSRCQDPILYRHSESTSKRLAATQETCATICKTLGVNSSGV